MPPPEMIDTVEKAVAAGLRGLPDVRGKANLALGWKRLRERHGPLEGEWEIGLSDGSVVTAPRGAQMTWVVAATGYWDRHVAGLVAPYVRPGTLVLDVGAALGLWTLPLGRIARDRGSRLWCFEPNPENIPWLTENIERNGLGRVAEVKPVALGARAGTAHLRHGEHGGGNGAVAVTETADSRAVPMERIDDLDLPLPVSFVKLDVEGFELEVLRGARRTIERDRPVVFGEFSSGWMRLRGEDLPAYLDSLAELDYHVFKIEDRRSAAWRPRDLAALRRIDPPFAEGEENLLLVPAGHAGTPGHGDARRRPPARLRGPLGRLPAREQRCGRTTAGAAWRIALSLLRRRLPAARVARVDIGGAVVRADLGTPLGAFLYRYGFCSEESRILGRLLRPGDVFVDGGANVGLFSLLAASAVGPGGRVLACEPVPGTMRLLEANAAENDLPALELHEVALSDRPGRERLVVFEDGSGLASFAPETSGGTPVEVTVTTLDELTSRFGNRVALVKLDIEGAEVKAVRGARDLIARSDPIFLIEVEPGHLARQGSSVKDLMGALAPRRYAAHAITPAGPVPLHGPWRAPDPECPNLLLVPPSRADRLAGPARAGQGGRRA